MGIVGYCLDIDSVYQIYGNSFSSHNHVRPTPIYRRKSQYTERLRDLPKATQLTCLEPGYDSRWV